MPLQILQKQNLKSQKIYSLLDLDTPAPEIGRGCRILCQKPKKYIRITAASKQVIINFF